jgi:superfamily I DNA/RNA helicase
MDAAARNLKERITNLFSQNIELPNISTIHGLALRIIKENSNYSVLNLPDDFEICDENQKQKIIYEILSKFKIDTEKYESYEKSISAIKLSAKKFNLYSKYKDIKDFIKFFNEYNKTLRLNNLID